MSSKANGHVSRRPRADVLLEVAVPGFAAAELSLAVAGRVLTVSGHVPRVEVVPQRYQVHPDSVPD